MVLKSLRTQVLCTTIQSNRKINYILCDLIFEPWGWNEFVFSNFFFFILLSFLIATTDPLKKKKSKITKDLGGCNHAEG